MSMLLLFLPVMFVLVFAISLVSVHQHIDVKMSFISK